MGVLFVSATAGATHMARRDTKIPLVSKRRRVARYYPCAVAEPASPLVRVRTVLPAVLVSGLDRERFVNGMGTNAYGPAVPRATQTIFTSNVGRCIDLVTAVRLDDAVLLLSSLPDGELYTYLGKYIFPADDVAISNAPIERAVEVMGVSPGSIRVPSDYDAVPATHGLTLIPKQGERVRMDGASPFSSERVSSLGRMSRDESEWENMRVRFGIPALGIDVTSKHTPLEAGLWHCVSFEKGCYIGQETIARLNTYNGVKRRLCAMEYEEPVKVGDRIQSSGNSHPADRITSATSSGNVCRALGYVQLGNNNDVVAEVSVGNVRGTVIDSPFLKIGFDNRSRLII